MNKPICTVMIGLPGLGKSYQANLIRKQYDIIAQDIFVYSTDTEIERRCEFNGWTYNEGFLEFIEPATKYMNEKLEIAIRSKQDVIWDQTNLGINKREKIINRMTQSGYTVNGVCVMPPDMLAKHSNALQDARAACNEWAERLMHRPGKTIPTEVMVNMIKSFVPPTIEEGFNSITFYDMEGNLLAIDHNTHKPETK